MESKIIQHTIKIGGRKTSVSIEDNFWNSLKEIANSRHESLPHLIANIDAERKSPNLSSAIRLFVVGVYRDQYNSGSKNADIAARPLEQGAEMSQESILE